MPLIQGYSSDENDAAMSPTGDAFGISAIPAPKKARIEQASLEKVDSSAPDVLIEDPLKQTSLITRPSDTQMNVNIPYSDMTLPIQGPENPFSDRSRFENQNALAGHVEEQAMTEHSFRQQHLTYNILGYSANPSTDPDAPAILGSVEKARANDFATVGSLSVSHAKRKELKRKRMPKGDVDIVEGEGAYVGPWAGWEGDDVSTELPEGALDAGDEEEEEEEEEEPIPTRRKAKGKRGTAGQESSIFHGKSMTDYQGRTYMHPPLAEAPHIMQEPGTQDCFIPKVGSMDTKIKLWDVYSTGNCLRTFMGHTKAVKDMKLWDTETGQCIKRFSNGKIPYVIKFHPDEDKQNIFMAGMSDKKIIQYDMDSGEITQEYDQHLGPVNTITFVDENRRFVTTSDDKTIRAWDFDIPVVIKYIAEPFMHSMPAVTLHPSNNQILIYSTDNFRQNRKKRFAGHSVAGYACQIGFSPDGKWVSSGDSSGDVVFWDWKTGRIKSRLKAHQKVVIAHEWLPHETSKVLTASWDGVARKSQVNHNRTRTRYTTHGEHDVHELETKLTTVVATMASITNKSPEAAKPAKRSTRNSIRHSLNLASVGKALADVMNKDGKESDRRKSTMSLRKDVSSRRVSTVGFARGKSTLDPVLEGHSRTITSPDLKTVTQSTRSSSSLQAAGRSSVDETGSKVTTTATPQMATLNRVALRPRKPPTGSALPKYRPKSAIVEGLPRRSISPVHAGTRRKHSSTEEDRDNSSTCAHIVHSPMENVNRPISPIPRRASKAVPSPPAKNGGDKPTTPRKERVSRDSPATSTPPRPKKTQRPSSSSSSSSVVKRTGLPRPSHREDSPVSSSSSPKTPTSTKSAASRYYNAHSGGRESPSPLRSSSALNGSPSARRKTVKSFVDSESESNQNTPTAIAVMNAYECSSEGPGNDSVDDVEFMLAAMASPSAPTPAIPRIRATLQVPYAPETPSRASLRPQRSTLGLSLAPPDDMPSLPPSRKSSPDRRPSAERSSIASWEKLADLSVEINAAELGGGLITELDLPTTPGMLSPSPSVMRLDSERGGQESPTPLTLPSPGGYTSISQVLLPAVTPSPAPVMHSLHSNQFFDDGYNGSSDLPVMDSAMVTLLKLQLASVENLAKERLSQITQMEEQMHALKEVRKREERGLLPHVNELEERLHETLVMRELDHESSDAGACRGVLEDTIDSHAQCRDALEEYARQAESSHREAISNIISEFSDRERAERAQLLLQVEKKQQLVFAVSDAGKHWQHVRSVADEELGAIRANRETLAVLRAGLDFFEAQVHISRCIHIPPLAATRFHLT
ncbi:hypothetical protein EW145_g163 [Phellinidium pouzarii]|uniref:Pre-mRNA-processing factor 17 n=1 Tax=Phellinidium pouzarii TaxID=167371 RepID=A0A4S4LPW6_9AGAM|nr:hypothetical protein EW145_g163 [Phellinidium pouzarii]